MYSPCIGHYEDTLSIIYSNNLIEYNIGNDSFTLYEDVISDNDVYSLGQYSTQINDTMYLISRTSDNLSVFSIYDLSTSTFIYYWQNITFPIYVGFSACIAHSSSFIYIVGGNDDSASARNTTQIFDLSSYNWSIGPSMQDKRSLLSCIVSPSNHNLYAVGGLNGIMQILLD